MYKAFRIKLDDIRQIVSTYKLYGKKQSLSINESLQPAMEKYLDVNGVLSGQRIMDDWFSQVKADVFISHSHRDDDDVHGLAGWLYQNFGLVSFIDADVWGYCDNLIKKMDEEYSTKNGKLDYASIRQTTAHVHVMLMSALSKMINKTECLFFLDSDQSISARDTVLKTRSPWIYNELLISSMIKPQVLTRKKVRIQDSRLILERREFAATEMQVDYPVAYKHMKSISGTELNNWLAWYKRYRGNTSATYREFPLDILYWLNG